MAKLKTNRLNQTGQRLAVCIGSAMLGFVLGGNIVIPTGANQPQLAQQSNEKVIERMEFPNEPFEFGNLSVKKVQIAPGQTFNARTLAERGGGAVEDWLENLEFTIKNKSDKRIVSIDISLGFPDSGSGGMVNYPYLGLGINPRGASEERAKFAQPFSLDPGDTVTFTLSAEQLEQIKNFFLVHFARLSNFRLNNLNKAIIGIYRVIFDDGTVWYYQGGYPALQPSDEKVIVTAEHPDDPLKFGDLVGVKNTKSAPGRKFKVRSITESGGGVDDWLEGLTFSFKNISDKPITYIRFELQFPDTTSAGPLMVYRTLGIGLPPKESGDEVRNTKPLALDPGDTVSFTLPAEHLQKIKDFLARGKFQLTEMNKVVVQILYLIFDDRVKWTIGGAYYKPNPSAPGGYERIKQ
jgi:hypothetical protein